MTSTRSWICQNEPEGKGEPCGTTNFSQFCTSCGADRPEDADSASADEAIHPDTNALGQEDSMANEPTLKDCITAVSACVKDLDDLKDVVEKMRDTAKNDAQRLSTETRAAHNRIDTLQKSVDALAPGLAKAVEGLLKLVEGKAPIQPENPATPPPADRPRQPRNRPTAPTVEAPAPAPAETPASSDPRDLFRATQHP